MNFLVTSFLKDLARWRQDWLATLIWMAIPLLVGGLITTMIGSGAAPHGTLLLVDEDETFLSEFIVGAYSAGELGDLLSVEKTDYEDGLVRVNDGDASALLVIPAGFTNALLESTPVTLTLRTNPSQTILPGIITNVTEVLLDAGFYAHQLFGDEINTITGMDEEPTDVEVAAIAVAIQNKIEVVAPKLFPPVLDLDVVEPPPEEPRPPLALLFLPGIILMAVIFSSNGLAADFWAERDAGTLRRLVFAPGHIGGFVLGKAAAAAVVIGLVGGFTLVLGFAYHGIAWSELPSSLIWISLSGVAFFAWFSALQMLFSNQKAAGTISMVIVFPLLMAGGSFFPLAVMPDWMAAIGRASPNGFVGDRLATELTTAGAFSIDASSWVGVLGAAALGLAICVWRMRTGFARR